MAELTLPKDFFFGAAMSGPQTEGGWNVGGKLENLWDTWSNEDIGAFHKRVGSYVGNDFMHRYQEDLAILKGLGLDSFRTSIQWSRLLDADGNVNPGGAAWYHELFRAGARGGARALRDPLPLLTSPPTSSAARGWESRETCEAYANYVEKALHEFGKEVRYWVHVQRAERRAREPLLARWLVPAAPQLPRGRGDTANVKTTIRANASRRPC